MAGLRWVAIAGVVVAVALATPQTGAFSTVSTDRGVTVTVADDESAYLAIEQSPVTVTENRTETTTLLTVTNRFRTSITVTATQTGDETSTGEFVHDVTGPGSLGVGSSGPVRARLTCGNDTATEQVPVSIRASGAGISVVVNRTAETRCA